MSSSATVHNAVAIGGAAALLLLGSARLAHAGPLDPEAVSIAWTAPEECPSGAELSVRTAARLPPDASVRARGHVVRTTARRYRLVLEIEAKGERTLEASTCDELVSSAAVVLAMSVSPPSASSPEAKPEPTPAPVLAPADGTVRATTPERPLPTPSRERRLFGGRLHAIADAGTLPAVGAGGGIALGVDPLARLHLEVGANLWATQEGTLATDPSRGASFQLVTAGARGCWGLTRSIVLAPCLGGEVVVLTGSGFGAARTSDRTSVTWAPEAALTLMVPLGDHFALRAGLSVTAPISRQAFVIAAGGEVHRGAALVARGFLGPEVVF